MIPLGYRKIARLRVGDVAIHNSSEFCIRLVNIFEYTVRNPNFSISKRLLDLSLFHLLDIQGLSFSGLIPELIS